MPNYIALRLWGTTSKDSISLVDETAFPITIPNLATGDYEVGRANFKWSGKKTVVSGPPPTPELTPLAVNAVDGRVQGADIVTFQRAWASQPTAITIVSQTLAGAFQMKADGVTLQYGPTMIDYAQMPLIDLVLRYSDANGGPYDFAVTATVHKSAAPLGGSFALNFDVLPDMLAPVVTIGTPVTTTNSATIPLSLNEIGGTFYYLYSASPTAPAGTIIATPAGSFAVTKTGAQDDIVLSGLAANSSDFLHTVHVDGAGNISNVVSVQIVTQPAGPTGLQGINSPITLWNNTSGAATMTATMDMVAGELIVLCFNAWTGSTGLPPSTQWTVTVDGQPTTLVRETSGSILAIASAFYSFIAPTTKNGVVVSMTMSIVGRASQGFAWRITGYDAAAPFPSNDSNSFFNSDTTTLNSPNGFVPQKVGNAVLACILIRRGGEAINISVANAQGSVILETGGGTTSDISGGISWQGNLPAAAITHTWSWLNTARAAAHRIEVAAAP